MKPFVLVTVEDNAVSDTTVVGDSQVAVIVVDFDNVEMETGAAEELLSEIMDQYESGDGPLPDSVQAVVDRLEKIAEEEQDEEEEDFDEDEEDDDEDEDFEDEEDEDDEEDDEDDEEERLADEADARNVLSSHDTNDGF